MAIQLLLDDPLLDKPDQIMCKLVDHVTYVIDTLQINSDSIDESEIADLQLKEINESLATESSVSLHNIYDEIKKQGKINSQPFNIFLASYCSISDDGLTKAACIQGRIIIAAAFLSRQQGYGDVIKRALNACRLIFTDLKYAGLFKSLPPFTGKLSELIEQIANEKNRAYLGGHHLTAIIALFKKYQTRSPKYHPRNITRKNDDNSLGERPDYEEIKSLYVPDIGEHLIKEFASIQTDENLEDFNIDEHERVTDQRSASRYFDIKLVAPNEVNQSLALQNQQARAAANHIIRREKQLTCDYRQLSDHDVFCLVKHCFDHIDEEASYTYLLAVLFTGQSLNDLINHKGRLKIAARKPFNNQPVWIFSPSLPAHEVSPKLETLLTRPTGKVVLVLPSQLTSVLSNTPPTENKLSEHITTVIKEINQSKTTRLTLARIQNYLSFYLNAKGIDATEIALILGKSIAQEPGCSYYQVDVSKLRCIHQDFVSEMMLNTEQPLTHVITQSSAKLVGSRLIVKTNKVALLFHLLSERLNAHRKQGWSGLEHFHNIYIIYVITLLNLATGHRPVRNPYETFDCFDLEAGTVFISDKEVRSSLSARIIPLPQMAIEQVKLYLEHLDIMQNLIAHHDSETGKCITKARKGDLPLLFFLNDMKFIPVTPGSLDAFCYDIWPLRQNWHRHFMRTWLRTQDIHGHIVDAWMGHVGTTGDGFSRYSALAMKDTRDIATKINDLFLHTLHLKAEKPWGEG